MGAYVITRHPKPFGTDLQNYKKVREEIILSFNPAQQDFLHKKKWRYQRIPHTCKVKISFAYNFTGKDDLLFRILFGDYKIFNYCKNTVDFVI